MGQQQLGVGSSFDESEGNGMAQESAETKAAPPAEAPIPNATAVARAPKVPTPEAKAAALAAVDRLGEPENPVSDHPIAVAVDRYLQRIRDVAALMRTHLASELKEKAEEIETLKKSYQDVDKLLSAKKAEGAL